MKKEREKQSAGRAWGRQNRKEKGQKGASHSKLLKREKSEERFEQLG